MRLARSQTFLATLVLAIWLGGLADAQAASEAVTPTVQKTELTSPAKSTALEVNAEGKQAIVGPSVRTGAGGLDGLNAVLRANRELEAQETMARWAGPLFWATVLQGVLGALGFAALVLTILQGRAALTVAKHSLESTLAEQRPWLDPEISVRGKIEVTEDVVRARMQVKLHNHGKTPAQRTRFAIAGVRQTVGEPNVDKAWELVNASIALQEKRGDGHVIFPSNSREYVPLLQFRNVDMDGEEDAPFELHFCLLATYEWGDGVRGVTAATGAIRAAGGSGQLRLSDFGPFGAPPTRLVRFRYEDTYS